MIPRVTRFMRILSVTLITAGLVVLSDVAVTLAWKEPISAFYASLEQRQAAEDLEAVEADFRALPAVRELDADTSEADAARLAGLFAKRMTEGEPIGRIRLPSIGEDYVVIEGTGTAELKEGPGHYPETALPGQGRTIGIAGHRTTYGAPFNQIDEIEKGDLIEVEMPYGTFRYGVTGTRIVEPQQTEVVDDVGRERLVLSACHPLYSAAQRYIVFADLDEIELLDAPR